MALLDVPAQSNTLRLMLRQIYSETMARIAVSDCIEKSIHCDGPILRIADLSYDLSQFRRIVVLSIGKAALPAIEVLMRRIRSAGIASDHLQALAVGPGDSSARSEGIEVILGGHPIPNQQSRDAARRAVKLLSGLGAGDLVLFLVSGGSSAMLELPVQESISVQETADFHRALVHSGLGIAEMNVLRKHFSAVKGGRLAELAGRATQCTLLVSDVPADMLHVIGSGPSLPDPTTREDCRRLMQQANLSLQMPTRVREYFASASLIETPKADHECFRNAQWRCLLSSDTMLNVAAELCVAQGFHAVVDNICDEWDYRRAADYLIDRLRALTADHGRVCLLSAGELSVKIERSAGIGGRNQQFALYCATHLQSASEEFAVLSVGSDGIDGNSPAAGAVVDATTIARAESLGLSAASSLEEFNSFPFFEQLGDAILSGPTGNNVRDLRILCGIRRRV
jgi:glycerate 2-kinase